jgi:hypothetical protein
MAPPLKKPAQKVKTEGFNTKLALAVKSGKVLIHTTMTTTTKRKRKRKKRRDERGPRD